MNFTEGFVKEQRLVGMAYICVFVHFYDFEKKETKNSYLEIFLNN
jgi:hypothetical protein